MSDRRPAVYRCLEAIPELGARPGDYLHIDLSREKPLAVIRELEPGHLPFVCYNLGALELVSGPPYEPPPRGVWVLPFRDHPVQPLTAAITSDGRLLAMLPVPAVTAIPANEKPRCGPALLDEADPRPPRRGPAPAAPGRAYPSGDVTMYCVRWPHLGQRT